MLGMTSAMYLPKRIVGSSTECTKIPGHAYTFHGFIPSGDGAPLLEAKTSNSWPDRPICDGQEKGEGHGVGRLYLPHVFSWFFSKKEWCAWTREWCAKPRIDAPCRFPNF